MSSRRSFPWFPTLVLLLAAGAEAWALTSEELERNLKGWITLAIPLLALILLIPWFLLSRRFSGKSRLFGLAGLLLAVGVLKWMVRVDGVVDGRGLPRLVWRWSKSSAIPSQVLTAPVKTEVRAVSADPRLAQAVDVPQFFGPNRDGLAPPFPLDLDWAKTPPRELWRQRVGAGWSAFAVVQGRAVTQEQRGEEELVTCYELLTGRLLWAHADKARFTQWQGGEGPRATPTVHQGRVFAYGATGLLNCLDLATGQKVWQRRVLEEAQCTNLEWGLCASPLIVDDKVIVTRGGAKGAVLLAYRAEDGAPLWQKGDDQASYASPVLATLAGRRVILSNNARSLTVHDPATGEVLLEHAWGVEKWPKASQPVVISPNQVFLSAGYGMGCLLLEVAADASGRLTASELWKSMKMKTQFNSAARLGGHLYGLDDGRLACLDLATGERLWKEGRFASGQTLLTGQSVIVQSESGPVYLCAASPEGFRELGRLEALSSKTWNHPVLAGRYLLVRNDREAVCYELPVLKAAP